MLIELPAKVSTREPLPTQIPYDRVPCVVMVPELRQVTTRKGDRMAVLQLEDPVRSRVLAVAMKRPASNASFVSSLGGGAMSAFSSLLPLPKNGMPSKN